MRDKLADLLILGLFLDLCVGGFIFEVFDLSLEVLQLPLYEIFVHILGGEAIGLKGNLVCEVQIGRPLNFRFVP